MTMHPSVAVSIGKQNTAI